MGRVLGDKGLSMHVFIPAHVALASLLACHTQRFPTWMWRNTVMLDFLDRLKKHNTAIPPDGRRAHGVGFYGE